MKQFFILPPSIIALLFLSPFWVYGQPLQGLVQDAATGLPLIAANIQIKGTYQGTISNSQGRFQLIIPHFPVRLRTSYIGYRSEEILLPVATEETITINLQPEPIIMEAMVITAENPAVNIMRKVIAQKKLWRDSLRTFAADAYTRLRVANDTTIVLISESTSRIFWDKQRGSREVVTSLKQTANFAREMGPIGSSGIPNFYDDDILLAGYTFIGPTHPNALDHYHFELLNRLSLDGKQVYEIAVKPKDNRQTAFTGSIYIQAETYALLQVDLETGKAIPPAPFFPEMFFRCQQQFSTFGKKFWLPVDWRMSGAMRIAMTGLAFPKMKFEFFTNLSGYAPNAVLPDSLYRPGLRSRPVRQQASSLLAIENRGIPLTFEEEKAYQTIDSSMTFLKAFKPTGYLARFIKVETSSNTVTASAGAGSQPRSGRRLLSLQPLPEFNYNRVDGLRIGVGLGVLQKKESGFFTKGAYNFGLRKWDYDVTARWGLSAQRRLNWEIGYASISREFADSAPYSALMTGLASLLGFRDYHHYYWSQGWRTGLTMKPRHNLKLEIAYEANRHSNLETTTDWRLFQRPHCINPAATAGRLGEARATVQWGELENNAGLTGRTAAMLSVEKSTPKWFGDFDYTRLQTKLEWSVRTFCPRRLFPNSLDGMVIGGRTWGDVPIQRLLHTDGSLGFIAPFGSFRTLRTMPLYAEKYLAVFAEHNFRSLPFELIGCNYLTERGIQVSVHGASGYLWLGQPFSEQLQQSRRSGKGYHELGFSISGLATLARLDFTCRLAHEPAWFVSLGLTRLF